MQGCLAILLFLTAFPGLGASIVNAVGGGTLFLAGRSAVERLERVLLLRVAVDGESKDMEEVACDRRFTAGELTPASSLEVSAGKADRFNGALALLEKEAVWLPGTVDRRTDCRIGRRECLIDSSVILLSSKNCDSMGYADLRWAGARVFLLASSDILPVSSSVQLPSFRSER